MRRSSSPGCAASNVVAGRFTCTSPAAGISSVCVLRHSLGSNARHAWAVTIADATMTQKLWSGRDRGIRFIVFRDCGEKPLIQERRENCDHGDGDKRADAIELIKLRKIVKEKFYDCDAKQCQAGVTRRSDSFSDSDNEQQKGEQPPCDAVAHVAREIP